MGNLPDNNTAKSNSKLASVLLIAFSISFLIAFPVVILGLVGMGVDAYFHTGHTYTIGGVILGFIASFYNIYRFLKKLF